MNNNNPLNMDAIRARLSGARGKQYWRTLGELLGNEDTQEFLADEIPQTTRMAGMHMDRRQFLTLAGASLALAGLSGCRYKEQKKLVPYVRKPEEVIEGIPLVYATAIPSIGGYGVGSLVTSREGRPIKMEGNPDHPASLGRLDALGQASILPLYDPDRSQVVTSQGEVSSWKEFFDKARGAFALQRASGGAGIRILTETITSPTLAAQMKDLLAQYPNARWVQYEPAGRDNVREGARLAFGTPVNTIYNLDKAKRILSLDADFLMSMPGSVRYARDFISGRRVRSATSEADLSRLYVVECSPSITGAMADHKLPMKPSQIEPIARAIAAGLGVAGVTAGALDAGTQKFVAAAVKDLQSAPHGSSVVIPGDFQSPAVHVLAHAINETLGGVGVSATHTDPVEAAPTNQFADLVQLTSDLREGKVDVLLIVGGNPVYNAPKDLGLREQIRKPAFRAHLGLYEDETSELCQWHLPETHFLEAWSDIRAYDGTASIIQPLIEPLYGNKSAHELLSGLVGEPRDGYALVQEHWAGQNTTGTFDFNKLLHDGVIANTAAAPRTVTLASGAIAGLPAPPAAANGFEITMRPDPNIWDGRHSNNGWLQELPKPFVKVTWDNAAYININTANKLHIQLDTDYAHPSDIIQVSFTDSSGKSRTEKVPVIIQPGVPDDTINLFLGYGRTRAGSIGNDIGYNAYNLFTTGAPWHFAADVQKLSDTYPLAVTTHHQTMYGRDIVRVGSIAEFKRRPSLAPEEGEGQVGEKGGDKHETPNREENLAIKNENGGKAEEQPNIYPDKEWKWPQPGDTQYGAYSWGMVVDQTACIGCNACMVACQAENNIPIVGKQQVLIGRHMNWIRIDTYYEANPEHHEDYVNNPGTYFQPMMCQHCEQAPCEPVCPVAATIHSHEGLNQMIYNRCIGTKYCSNNCPYKVRRFNFLNYANFFEIPVVKMRYNPEVTVRGRGVMEKCSFCVQRINIARQTAKMQERDLADGEIKTACQQTCPTNAIVFGNINDPNSEVSKLKTEPHNYGVLADLNTRPRTSYLGRVTNPNPELAQG